MGLSPSKGCCQSAREGTSEFCTKSVVLLFGGSFSPMQLSHVAAASLGKRAIEVSEYGLQVHSVRCSPVNDAYGKKGLWPASDRLLLGMLALQEAGEPGICLDPWESQQSRFMETHEVARYLSDSYKTAGKADLVMLLGGADMFEGMFCEKPTPKVPYIWDTLSVAQLVMVLDGVVIIQRGGSEAWERESIRSKLKTKLQGTEAGKKLDFFRIIIAKENAGDGSSTQVRELISGGLSSDAERTQLAQLVGKSVTQQILSKKGYFQGLVKQA
eukprot:TRINITY_DN57083_c0_g1_i1.p1 TRINITY_DN57083_c0_g1~~TRINITY_DN57083_c0_g1_i1.p1  ORF type:complete len:291 (+),score=72.31 TRINITY_DN57083_c0_g1_i1:61-873(+)